MRSLGFEPLSSYPGGHKPWPSRCLSCGSECAPQLAVIRNRGGGCPDCGRLRTTRASQKDSDQAVIEMRAAGGEPLEPYPGSKNPWKCRCLSCGREISPTLGNARKQGPCRACGIEKMKKAQRLNDDVAHKVMLESGLEPLDPYVNTGAPWRCRCLTCGEECFPTVDGVKRGSGCPVCGHERQAAKARTPEAVAIARMRAGGYEPLEPYPGNKDKRWRCLCLGCGREVSPTMGNVHHGKRCPWCAGQRIDGDEAAAEMRSLGAEPLEPYPGKNSKPWRCRCTKCGQEITPTFSNARRFSPCRYCCPMGIWVCCRNR